MPLPGVYKDGKPRSPRRAEHLGGLPRFKHAHLSGGEFVFNGAAFTEKDCALMDSSAASWQTPNRKYKRTMMCQENGYIAAERHRLANEAVDRIYVLVAERDRAAFLLREHNGSMAETSALVMGGSHLHSLDGPRAEARAEKHADTVLAARLAVQARYKPDRRAGDGPTWRELAAKKGAAASLSEDAAIVAARKAARGPALSVQEERSFMRFLKEGPRRGDGSFEEPPLQLPERLMRASMDRTTQLRNAEKLWERKYP